MASGDGGGRSAAAREWRAYWGIVFAGMIGTGFVAMPPQTLGLFMQPLQASFGWSRSDVSLAMTVFAVVSTPLVPFAGALADRYGSRRVLIPGIVLNALAVAAFGLLTGSIRDYVMVWVAYTLTQLLVRTAIWNRAASAAFTASRGLALAALMGGIPLAQTISPILANALIRDLGWRAAYAALGLGWGGLLLIVTVALFREPSARNAGAHPAPALGGLAFGAALREPRLIRIALAILIQVAMASALAIHLFPLLQDAGLGAGEAARIVALLGVAGFVGQLGAGWLADRFAATLLPAACFALPALAYLLLLRAGGSTALLVLAVLVCGLAGSACMTITTYLTARYAGVRHFGKIYGVISSCMGLGAGIGPLLAGAIFDRTHSYAGLLLVGIGETVVAALLMLGLGPYPTFRADAEAEAFA